MDARIAGIESSAVEPVERVPGRGERSPAGPSRDQLSADVPADADSEPISPRRAAPPERVAEPVEIRQAPRVESPRPAPETRPAPLPKVSITPDSRWFEGAPGFENGWERAKETKQPVLVYFYTDWCGYCRQLESKLLDHSEVRDFTRYLVKVKINPERGSNERMVADYYGVRGYPSVFVHRAGPGASKKVRSMSRQSGEWTLMTPRAYVDVLADAAVGR